MPRGDGTGPGGLGPMTGRAAGYCAGYNTPGFMNPYGARFGAGALYRYPQGSGSGAYPGSDYGWGGYPLYGGFGRSLSPGFVAGAGRGGRGGRGAGRRGGRGPGRGGW